MIPTTVNVSGLDTLTIGSQINSTLLPFDLPVIPAVSAFADVIRPGDISLGVLESAQGSALSKSSATMFFFLIMLDLYRTAVNDAGDATVPDTPWIKRYSGMIFGVHPHREGSMQYSHVFFGTIWVWLWMSDLVPDSPDPDSGFYERMYVVLLKEAPSDRLGYIDIRLDPMGDSTQHATQPVHDSNMISAQSVPRSVNGTSNVLYSAYSMSPITSHVYSDPFPVPGSDLILLFGPPTPILLRIRIRIPQILLQFLEKAWLLIAENRHEVPFPGASPSMGAVQIVLQPRLDTSGSPLTTGTMVTDAVIGIMYYMLRHGYFGSKVSLVWPEISGKRSVVGTFDIKQVSSAGIASEE